MVRLSKKDLTIIAGVLGAIDFAYEGALTKPVSRAVKKALVAGASRVFLNPGQIPTNRALAGAIGRSAVGGVARVGGTALAVGRTIAMRHPYLTAGAVIYYTVKNRDDIERIVRDGYEVLDDIGSQALPTPTPFAQDFMADPFGASAELIRSRPRIPGRLMPTIRRKTQTKFNKAVSKGMKVVKASTSYGKKGTISNSKKAFSAVTKTVSKINKGAKIAKSGITRKIGLAVKGIFK